MAKRLGERLVDAGIITHDALGRALAAQKACPGARIGECLLSLGLISEQALLKFLATEYQARYLPAEKLARLEVAPELTDMVPVRLAETHVLMPFLFDAERRALTVAMAEPQNTSVLDELRIVANAAEVVVCVATRSAVQAAIRRFYYGDPTAFDELLSTGKDGRREEVGSVAAWLDGSGPRPRTGPTWGASSSSFSALSASSPAGGEHELARRDSDYLETLDVLLRLVEAAHPEAMRDHSGTIARRATAVAQRLGLTTREAGHVCVAAYLHALGKPPDRHLTVLSVGKSAELREEATRHLRSPIRLFERVHLPMAVNAILAQLFEAYDGTGFPQGEAGDAIPIGARIIAAVDSYEDLVSNVDNAIGRLLEKEEALARVQKAAGTLLDPTVVDALSQIQSGEVLRYQIASDGRHALLWHAEEAVQTDMRDALLKVGFTTSLAVSLDAVLDAARRRETDLVLLELAPGRPEALAALEALRLEPATVGMPVLLLAERADPALVDRLASASAVEVVPVSMEPQEIAVRAKALWDDCRAHGAPMRCLSGLLDEMSMSDLLKTLAGGRRSARLSLRGSERSGEIQIDRGRIVNVVSGEAVGERAFDELMRVRYGHFVLDPEFLALEPQMDKDIDVMLREWTQRRRAAR